MAGNFAYYSGLRLIGNEGNAVWLIGHADSILWLADRSTSFRCVVPRTESDGGLVGCNNKGVVTVHLVDFQKLVGRDAGRIRGRETLIDNAFGRCNGGTRRLKAAVLAAVTRVERVEIVVNEDVVLRGHVAVRSMLARGGRGRKAALEI